MDIKREAERLDEELAFKIETDGNTVICYIVLDFQDSNTGKKYLVYADGTKNKDGTLELLASTYTLNDNSMILEEITDDSEWDLVDEMLKRVGEVSE